MEKSRIYVYIVGGFTDNLKIYNIKETELAKYFNITFVIKNNYKSPTLSSNKDLLKLYNFDDIITEDKLPKNIKEANFMPQKIDEIKPNLIYCYMMKSLGRSALFISKHILTPHIKDKLLHPNKELSQYSKSLIEILKQDKWIILGNRCTYLQKAIHGKDKLERLLLMCDYLEKNPQIKNILLILDDINFLKAFRYIFGDLLVNRNIIYLRITNNSEHEYIQIATYCTPLTKIAKGIPKKFNKFIHDHSGFYNLLEEYVGMSLVH